MTVHQTPAGKCDRCGRVMRWQDEPRDGRPGRRVLGSCTGCYMKGTAVRRFNTSPEVTAATVSDLTAWMDAYVADRRRRNVPPTGANRPAGEFEPGTKVSTWSPK